MAEPHITRVDIEYPILETARQGGHFIQIIEGPRGAGKTTLLHRLAARLSANGIIAPFVDLDQVCTSPMAFAQAFCSQVSDAAGPAAQDSSLSGIARLRRQVETECARRRPDPPALIELALSAPGVLAADTRRPAIVLLDEAAEVLRLTRHAGLRDSLAMICRSLANSQFSLIVAVSPASRPEPFLKLLAEESGESVQSLHVPPLSEREVIQLVTARHCAPPRDDMRQAWMNATNGHPLYVAALAERVAAGEDIATAMIAALTPPLGVLYQECRYDYHLLVERSRGQAVVRAILDLLSREEGANLTRVADHLKIALPTALDYLSWLLEVGLARRDGSGYVITDPLLALWIRLNGPGREDLFEAVLAFLDRPRVAPRPAAPPRGRRPGVAGPRQPVARSSTEFRIEID